MKSLTEQWALKGPEVAALLGVSPSTWDRMSAGRWEKSLSQDQLTRVSALVGVFKGLHLLFADEMADRWMRLPNKGPLFENRTPIEAMIARTEVSANAVFRSSARTRGLAASAKGDIRVVGYSLTCSPKRSTSARTPASNTCGKTWGPPHDVDNTATTAP